MNAYRNHLILCLVICLFFVLRPLNGYAADDEVVIKSLPENILFAITGMAPGKNESQTIEIQNSGKQNFQYQTFVTLKSGSQELYNELLLQVLDGSNVLYQGQLKDFNQLSTRFVQNSNKDTLVLNLSAPASMGNDFQGLKCELEFRFHAQGILNSSSAPAGSELPSTGTNMFNLIALGFFIIFIGFFVKRIMAKTW